MNLVEIKVICLRFKDFNLGITFQLKMKAKKRAMIPFWQLK